MKFRIIYPERRIISDSQIITWASDAVANGIIDSQDVDVYDAQDCARALHDSGFITLAKQ